MGITSETRRCRDCGKPLSITQRGNAKYCFECAEERQKEARRTASKKYGKKHRKERSQYQKDRREWLKAHNFCVVCGSEKAIDGLTMCESCREKDLIRAKKYRQKKKA